MQRSGTKSWNTQNSSQQPRASNDSRQHGPDFTGQPATVLASISPLSLCLPSNHANISNGYMDEDLVEVHIDKIEKYKKYMLQDGDVIISARGTKISTAVAENIKERNIIATGNLIVVRCNDTLEPYYLKAFFDSDEGNLCLSVAQTGSTIFAINPKQLCELQYDALDMEKQKRIAIKEESLIHELHESIHRVEALRRNIAGVYDCFKE